MFSRLLDREGGSFSLSPSGQFSVNRQYLAGTAVLETTFSTSTGRARVIDCLPAIDGVSTIRPMREILRIVEGIEGSVTFSAGIDPRPDYARQKPNLKNRGRLGWSYIWDNALLHVMSDLELSVESTVLGATFTVAAGERRYLSLSYTEGEPAVFPLVGPDADERLADTIKWWQEWSAQIAYTGMHRASIVRSAITLKLMTFVLSGAVVAAPTTSLPEELGGARNWDYRYCWLRDAGLTMEAMIGIGIKDDAAEFLKWLLHATRLTWPKLQIMYDVYGRTNLEEYELPNLSGYRDSRPVRVGNGAFGQLQLDVYGEVIHAADVFAKAGGDFGAAGSRMLAGLGDTIVKIWREPDNGIWEKRGERFHYTYSKVMCWVALDRLIDMHDRKLLTLGEDIETYRQERAAVAELIEERGFNRSLNAYTKVFYGDLLDASLLLMPTVGYGKADSARMTSTFSLIDARLGHGGLLNRYEPEPGDNRKPEGTFGICSFWAIQQLALRGDLAEAEARFTHLISFGNDVGLFAEEIAADTGAALGNFPQAFTHVGLINAALAIEQARSNRDKGAE